MPRNRNRRGLELGVMLLMWDLMNVGLTHIPPVTLFTIFGQALLYAGIINPPWSKLDVCISARSVMKGKDYRRLFLSALEHGDDMHLYYNMISFLMKGRSLERRYGSPNFAFLLIVLSLLTSVTYVALGVLGELVFDDSYYATVCAIGFSGVIFALKVVTSAEEAPGMTMVGGVMLPLKYATWAELVLIHLLVPRSSFMGHLAGILAGLAYAKTPLGALTDSAITAITGDFMHHSHYF
ncbi:rhomboid-related protein 4-like isoform X2 [Bacillus rossius redtenbacheri]|uniref:rhomboid-related protein 4-like isoform X2 n=1 Tax=Bacillus rossius redtenbacheri TaxID=93214 RepID=UPI002FDEE953